jgi:hypothetical protein
MLPAVKTWMSVHRIRILVGGAVAAAVVAAVVTTLALTSSGSGKDRALPPTRARTYTERQACLLTGERGLADPAAAPVWAGMRDASAATHAKVTYLAMAGEQSPAAAGPYLATLAARQCTVVLTVGAAPDGAVPAAGTKFPGTRFVTVGAKSGAKAAGQGGAANITAVPGGSAADTRGAVKAALTDALRP